MEHLGLMSFYNQGMHTGLEPFDQEKFLQQLRLWGAELGLSQIGVAPRLAQ
jgi:hypothetical protein